MYTSSTYSKHYLKTNAIKHNHSKQEIDKIAYNMSTLSSKYKSLNHKSEYNN